MSDEKYKSTIPFIDLLFNLLIAVVFMFVLAFILINPITKEHDVPRKGEFIIRMTWPDENEDDVDLWVKGPGMGPVGFRNKEAGVIHYERDDLGGRNDHVIVDGKTIRVVNNEETVIIRGKVAGEYRISAHLYRIYSYEETIEPMPVTVEVAKINPGYEVIYKQTIDISRQGQIIDFYKFRVDEDGNVINIGESLESVVSLRGGFEE